MTTRLTVVIPCYNLAGRLPLTLATLQHAVDDQIELLFLDDASTDGTAEVIAAALPRLGRARLHRCETNLGLSGARNLGVRLAETTYLTFFDGDDTVAPGWFPALLGAIREAGTQLVRTDYVEVTGRQRLLRRVPTGFRDGRIGSPREAILPADQRTAVDYPYAWAGAYHRSLAESGLLTFPEELRTAEDRPWIWQLHLGAASFTVPKAFGVHYHRDQVGSLSRLTTSTQLDFVAAMQQVVRIVRADPEAERFLPKALRRWCELTLHHLGLMDRFSPEVRRTFRGLLATALAAVPEAELADALQRLTPERRSRITRLITDYVPAERSRR